MAKPTSDWGLYFQFGALPLDQQQPAGFDGGDAPGKMERSAAAVLGQQVYDQHKYRDELLARRGLQSSRCTSRCSISSITHARMAAAWQEPLWARGFVIHHNTDLGVILCRSTAFTRHLANGRSVAESSFVGPLRLHPRLRIPQTACVSVMKKPQILVTYLVDDGAGHLITGPSLSPENQYRAPDELRSNFAWVPRWIHRSRMLCSRGLSKRVSCSASISIPKQSGGGRAIGCLR